MTNTLAIAEYVAEQFPDKHLWPRDQAARARARSVCAEMHAGFTGLRGNCPMNIEASLRDTGALIWRDKPAVRADVARLVAMWQGLLGTHGGPMLFGEFSVADAYFAPRVHAPQDLRPARGGGCGGLCGAGVRIAWRPGLGTRRAGGEGLSGV